MSEAYYYFQTFWTDCLNFYEPLPSTLAQYLQKYEKEDELEFANRCRHLAQINMVYLIVETTISMMFSTNIEIKASKHEDKVNAFINRCNPQGDTLLDFLREQVAPTGMTYGFGDIVVDLPQQKDDKLSVAQAKSQGIQPYCYLIPPLNRYQWSVNSNGNFDKYCSQDILNVQIQGDLQMGGSMEQTKQYQLWTTDTVAKYDSEGNEISVQKNPYGFIPVVTCAPVSKSLRYPNERMGRSLIQDIIPIQRLILNVMSLIYDFHESANFPMRVLKQDTSDGDEAPTEEELQEQGNKRGFILRGKDSSYTLTEPNPSGVNAMVDYLELLIEKCYQQLSMPSDANTNKSHTSGDSVRSSNAVLFNKLTTFTRRMERCAKEIVEMSLRIQNIDPTEANVKVTWNNNFSYESAINSLQQLAMVIQTLADKSPTAVAETATRVMSPMLFGAKAGTMDKVMSELDAWAKKPIPAPDPNGDPQTKPQTLQQNETQSTAANKISEQEE